MIPLRCAGSTHSAPRSENAIHPLILDDQPQLAAVAILHAALPIAAEALEAHHGDWGSHATPEGATPSENYVLLLAGLIHPRCLELSDLLGAYRAAVAHLAESLDQDKPF